MQSRVLIFLFILLLPRTAYTEDRPVASSVTVQNIRHNVYPTHTRVVIDFDKIPEHTIDPPDSQSLSIHFANAVLGGRLKGKPVLLLQGPLTKVEVKEEGQDVIVLLGFKNMSGHQTLLLENPDRLVIDVTHSAEDVLRNDEVAKDQREEKEGDLPPPLLQPPASPPQFQIRTIVVDAGHGGEAPGAVGPTGLAEKDVVLDVALKLARMIEERLHRKVILTRDRDVFIPLSERTRIANDNKADLFVSIHANASRRRAAKGIETYLFGRTTDEAILATAARENETDEAAAKDFQEVILNDLSRDFTLNQALELAHYTQEAFVKTLISEYPTLSLGVKKAPFYVLAHTEMPAILAEISFVSNRVEEGWLRQGHYRKRIAESIFRGIKEYIEEHDR